MPQQSQDSPHEVLIGLAMEEVIEEAGIVIAMCKAKSAPAYLGAEREHFAYRKLVCELEEKASEVD